MGFFFFKFNFRAEDSPTSNPGFRHSTVTAVVVVVDEDVEDTESGEGRTEAPTKPLNVKTVNNDEEESRGEGVVSCA